MLPLPAPTLPFWGIGLAGSHGSDCYASKNLWLWGQKAFSAATFHCKWTQIFTFNVALDKWLRSHEVKSKLHKPWKVLMFIREWAKQTQHSKANWARNQSNLKFQSYQEKQKSTLKHSECVQNAKSNSIKIITKLTRKKALDKMNRFNVSMHIILYSQPLLLLENYLICL